MFGLGLLFCGLSAVVAVISFNSSLCSCSSFIGNHSDGYEAEEIKFLSPGEIIELRGYNHEIHYTRTKDGYNIYMVRIVNPKVKEPSKGPVIFGHGLIESPTTWLMSSRNVRPSDLSGVCDMEKIEKALKKSKSYPNPPFWLSNLGFDVWLFAFRGVDYSVEEDKKNSTKSRYWDFDLDDFALSDLPAVVDYVRDETGYSSVGYVGHSQATFAVLGLLSKLPEYAKIIDPVVAVAPIAYLAKAGFPVVRPLFEALEPTIKKNEPSPPKAMEVRESLRKLCSKKINQDLLHTCELIEMLLTGKGHKFLSGFTSQVPFTTSTKVLRNFVQLLKSKRFAMYDYGPKKNKILYGTKKAPAYKAKNIISKSLSFVSAKGDTLSTQPDIKRLKDDLTIPLFRDVVLSKDINHIDLITFPSAMYQVLKVSIEAFGNSDLSPDECKINACHDL